MSNYRK